METLEHFVDPFKPCLARHQLYHVAPLHYLPSILAHQKLFSAEQGALLGVLPRRTASRRDKMLGLHRYVHFSFDLITPLLQNKLSQGLPHIALVFNALQLDSSIPNEAGLLPFNAKAWKSRADAAPLFDRSKMASVIRAHDQFGRFPSLEYLVCESVELDCLQSIITFCQRDYELVIGVVGAFVPGMVDLVMLMSNTHYKDDTPILETLDYLDRCVTTKLVQPLPKIRFD
jgi:hypothetical protein